MKFFITSARSPVPLDWAQRLIHDGHQVVLADSLFFPLGRFCRGIERYIRLPKPSDGTRKYVDALIKAFHAVEADYLLPAYEEAFHIAHAAPKQWLESYAIIPDVNTLFTMHDKDQFLECVKDLGVLIPKTQRITTFEQIQNDFPSWFKPVMSRLGNDGKKVECLQQAHLLDISHKKPWVQQQYIQGRLISSYSFAWQGTRIAQANYLSKYCFNGAGGSYFIPMENPKISEFCRLFIEKYKWHGQIGFDFIEASEGIYVIDCNPRMTGGFHLLYNELDCTVWPPIASASQTTQPVHYRDTLFVFFWWDFWLKGKAEQLLDDHRHARDILFGENRNFLPKYATWLALTEYYYRRLRYRLSITQVMSMDIEWNQGCHKNTTKVSS